MNSDWNKDYPLLSNLSEADLDENLSLKKMLRLVEDNKRVIDFGCATGYFAQWLTAKGCQVTGVEVNAKAAKLAEQYCEQVIVADLDFVSVAEISSGQVFDVAVFGDVLEHLRDPWRVLKETQQILKPEGYVVASIPNIAHGAIRLAMLKGQFEYAEQGILDNTHLRFFTRKTVEELFERSGYFVVAMERTKLPIFADSNLIPTLDKSSFDIQIIETIEKDEESDTLQFVIRASPVSLKRKYATLHQQYSQLVEQAKKSHTQLDQFHEKLEKAETIIKDKEMQLECSQSQLQQTQTELEHSQSQLQQTQAKLECSQSQLKQTQKELEHSQNQLRQTQAELEHSQSQLQHSQVVWQEIQIQLKDALQRWDNSQNIIQAMESSKFWQLRLAWFRLKRSIGLKAD